MCNKITYDSHFNSLKINTNKEKGHGCFEKVLSIYHAHLDDMCSKHSKVWQQRFDLRYPADGSIDPDPKHRYVFSENLIKDLKRNTPIFNRKGKSKKKNPHHTDPRLIMVCEKGKTSNKIHIHGLVLINGNAKRNSNDIFTRIERQWANALNTDDVNGLVHYCNINGPGSYMLDRNNPDFDGKLNDAFYQASYLAKARDKDGLAKGSWLVTASRLPKDAKIDSKNNKNNAAIGV